jgi:hypothetical protein
MLTQYCCLFRNLNQSWAKLSSRTDSNRLLLILIHHGKIRNRSVKHLFSSLHLLTIPQNPRPRLQQNVLILRPPRLVCHPLICTLRRAHPSPDKEDKPKRAPSAYNLFVQAHMKEWKDSHPGAPIKEAMAEVRVIPAYMRIYSV